MKNIKKYNAIILTLFLLGFSFTLFAQQPNTTSRPSDFEYLSAPDSLGVRHQLKMPKQSLSKTSNPQLPYPIIFIHGLNSNAATWDITTNFMDIQYGTSYGGRMDFCLNYDANNSSANLSFAPATGADLAYFTSSIYNGDYYYLNFDVGSNGSVNLPSSNSYFVQSNQSAIYKQGLALKWAIYFVLQKTGKDKVILMGHSMGGLAAREYLQNTNLWQQDGKDHVAKLVTTGTPHGGSNSTSFGLGVAGLNEKSDAVRDLRRSYSISSANGVYLFGGVESNSVIKNNLLFNYENVDVNCNGIYNNVITGLNYKNIDTNIDYSCIIGQCSGCVTCSSCDGVVNDVSANLNSYYSSLTQNIFYYSASALTEIHTDLPKQNYKNMQGLDEPNSPKYAYQIDFDSIYNGFMTVQSTNYSFYPTDYDCYKFNVKYRSNVKFSIENIYLSNLSIAILDSVGNIVDTISSNGFSTINFSHILNIGAYYFIVIGNPNTTSYLYPYSFTLNKMPICDFAANKTTGNTPLTINFSDLSTENPTSWQWTFIGGSPSTSTLRNPTITYNTAGNYPVSLTSTNQYGNDSKAKTNYIIVTCIKPSVSFTNIINGKTVNLINNSIIATSYNWDFGDGQNSTTTNPVHIYNNAGSYSIKLTATNDCGFSYLIQNIIIAPEPTSNFTADLTSGKAPLTVNFSDLSTNLPTSWQWTFTGGNPSSSNLQNPSITYNSSGTYSVTLSSLNNSGTNTMTKTNYITVTPATDIYDIVNNNSFQVYPNPNNGSFTIQLKNTADKNGTITIVDMLGRTVYESLYKLNNNEDVISISQLHLKAGTYNVIIGKKDGVNSRKSFVVVGE